MIGRVFAALRLLVILVAVQGCATFDAIFEQLLLAAGRVSPAAIPCGEQTVQVSPGQCHFFSNACRADGDFVVGDSFAFDDPPEWLSVRNFSGTTRQVCVAADAPPVSMAFPYTYVAARPQGGTLRVITVPLIIGAEASATPTAIMLGQSVQLGVTVSGGQGPYRFVWALSDPVGPVVVFDDATRQNPVATVVSATNDVDLVFKVTATDVAGETVDDTVEVRVTVPLRVTATATPSIIAPGASSQLLATVEGGRPPYFYAWDPSATLFLSLSPDPIATPFVTTVYQVRVRDFDSQEVTAAVTVTVAEAPVSGANLEVSVVDSPDPVQRNQLLTYTITVRNNGPDTATGVTLTVTPPVQVESGPLTPSQGSCTRAGLTITCAIGTIVNGAAVTADIPMFPFTLGAVSLSATATATETDPDPSNNTTTQSTTVLPPS